MSLLPRGNPFSFALGSHAVARSPAATPAARLSGERLARIGESLRADVADGRIPGAVVMVAQGGSTAYFEAVGKRDPQADEPMARDALFRIYSMTKPITSVAAMMLAEEGRLRLDDPVSAYIPEFAELRVGVEKPGDDGKPVLQTRALSPLRPVMVHDLMRHTSGLTYGFFGPGLVKAAYNEANLFGDDPDNAEFARRLAALPLAFHPGTTWDYGYSTDVLGRVIEVASGQTLGEFFRSRIFAPLGMCNTGFYLPDAQQQARLAQPLPDDRQIGVGLDMSDPGRVLRFEGGGGGLVSNAEDYARFLQMLLDGGTLEGQRLLSPATLAYMTSDHLGRDIARTPLYIPGPGYGFGLGFAVRTGPGGASVPGSTGDYYWGGVGGTYMWVDPALDMFVVFMMQSPRQRTYYRSQIRQMVYAAVER